MYVNAPRRTTNGTTNVTKALGARAAYPPTNGYATPALAAANAYVMTDYMSTLLGSTTRSSMIKGVVGWHKYIVTPYGGTYRSIVHEGHVVNVLRYAFPSPGKEYYAESTPIRFGDTGFFQSGVGGSEDPLGVINPSGGSLLPIAIYNRAVIANLRNRAEVEAKLKLSNSGLDLAESLAGLDKTVLMVADAAARLIYAWRSVRNGKYRLAAKHLGIARKNLSFKNASEAWLAFQYGWRPLIMDIYNGTKYAISLMNEKSDLVRVTRRVSETLWAPKPDAGPYWGGYTCDSKAEAYVEVKLWAKVANSYLAYLSSLQLVNPAYLAWVTLPFSFVVDWLLPVGDFLASVTAPLGLQFTGGYRSTRVWGSVAVGAGTHTVRQPLVYSKITSFGHTRATAESLYMDRMKYNSWPMSRLYITLPFKSYERAVNTAALIKTTAKSLR